jgi:predicted anti-sigma-YlaC factor YlaD
MTSFRPADRLVLPAALLLATWLTGCSPRTIIIHTAADAFASTGEAFATDGDPELVREAAPFALKAMESFLAKTPEHRGLLTALSGGFTQYAAAFVWQDAVESLDPEAAEAGKDRARRLYLRARDYGLRGLEAAHPGFREALAKDPAGALSQAGPSDVSLLYWTAASWTLAIASSGMAPALLADLPLCEALMRRALFLDEGFDAGAIHEYFIAYEGSRPEATGRSVERARWHLERAMVFAEGKRVSPYVTLAETVSVRNQDKTEFLALLDRALAFDARREDPEFRLANLVAQRRARWLKERADELFLD